MTIPYSRCRICGRRRTEKRRISKRGLCARCARVRYESNITGMALKSGPDYDRWRRAMARFGQRIAS